MAKVEVKIVGVAKLKPTKNNNSKAFQNFLAILHIIIYDIYQIII